MVKVLINLIPAIALGFLLQLLLHEMGHLLGGLLTGWRLIHIQYFYLVLITENKKLKYKIVKPYDFQCIMYPKKEDCDALLYTLGGCLLNLISSLISIFFIIYNMENPVLLLYIWTFFVSGIILCIANGKPSIKNICNDGACYYLLKDVTTRQIHNKQFLVAERLHKGVTYHEIGLDLIMAPTSANNDILIYQLLLEYYYWLDMDNLGKCQCIINKLSNQEDLPISNSLQDLIRLEILCLKILDGLEAGVVKPLELSPQQKLTEFKQLKINTGDAHIERIRTIYQVYECLQLGLHSTAYEILVESKRRMKSLPCLYPGEANFCVRQLDKVTTMLFNDIMCKFM